LVAFDSRGSVTPLFAKDSTLLEITPLQAIDSRALSHSLQNKGGVPLSLSTVQPVTSVVSVKTEITGTANACQAPFRPVGGLRGRLGKNSAVKGCGVN
jgi:hypothetical protein